MGTVHDWFRVLIVGAIWGGFMGWMSSGPLMLVKPPRLYLRMRIMVCVLAGLVYGLVDTFNGRAFRPPLLFLFIGIVVGALVVGSFLRRLVRNVPQVPLYSSESPLFGQSDEKHRANRLS
jgi:hypothetical protein